jgi:hypothetical protein
MARKSAKDLSLLKRGLIKSCLGGVAPKSTKKPVVEDDDGDDEPRPKRAKGYASSVTK